MFKTVDVKIDEIYVPADRRKEIAADIINKYTDDMLNGETIKPIKVRDGKGRFVLIEGVNRLEASKAVGDITIGAYIVQARKF